MIRFVAPEPQVGGGVRWLVLQAYSDGSLRAESAHDSYDEAATAAGHPPRVLH